MRTFVVSWKDDAEMNDSVERDAFASASVGELGGMTMGSATLLPV